MEYTLSMGDSGGMQNITAVIWGLICQWKAINLIQDKFVLAVTVTTKANCIPVNSCVLQLKCTPAVRMDSVMLKITI